MQSRCVLLLLMTALLCGCSTVSSKAPLGDPASADDAKQLGGVWMTLDGDPICVQHIGGNEVRVAGMSWNKAESKFELEEGSAFLTQDEDHRFLNLAEPISTESESAEGSTVYDFVRVTELNDKWMMLVFPNVEAFAKAVESKVLPGSIEQTQSGKSVKLDATTEQLNKFVEAEKISEQFDAETSLPLVRIQAPPSDE